MAGLSDLSPAATAPGAGDAQGCGHGPGALEPTGTGLGGVSRDPGWICTFLVGQGWF